jgi:phage N-6-adenine-methyltransferase
MAHDNWETPPDLISRLQEEFLFDLDAAASPENTICDHYITQEQDALTTPWDGSVVWCNPPYSKLPAFTARALDQSQVHQNTIVLLIPAYTDTRWWRDHCLPASEIRFLVGRLKFWEAGAPRDSARFPSAVVIYHTLSGVSAPSPRIRWWDWRVTA